MKKRIEKEINNLKDNFVVLTILPREKYHDLNMHMVKLLVNKKDHFGAYVTINKSYHSLLKSMDKEKINHDKIIFLDCVSNSNREEHNCIFLNSPESLTKISIALDPIFKSKDHSFIFLDSLDGLSLYHDPNMVVRFARSLIGKIRHHEKSGVMLGLHEDTDKRIINEVSVVCDKVIDLS